LGDRSRRRWMLPAAAAVAAATILVAAGVAAAWVGSLGPAPLGERLEFSTVVVDRDGRLLRPYATTQGRWRLPVRADGVDPRYLALLVAYEDKRFREHAGVDVFALMRAAAQIIAHGRIVSGGSTLTMQVARLLEPAPSGRSTRSCARSFVPSRSSAISQRTRCSRFT
jgi:penicillin-binding protein 1C